MYCGHGERNVNKEKDWIEKAKGTAKIHKENMRNNESWRIQDTAKLLGRSTGLISEDLLVVQWIKTHEYELNKFDYKHDAVAWIRKKKLSLKLEN
jgi:hypothetical protein